MAEIKKKQALKKQLQTANENIYALEKTIKVKKNQNYIKNVENILLIYVDLEIKIKITS